MAVLPLLRNRLHPPLHPDRREHQTVPRRFAVAAPLLRMAKPVINLMPSYTTKSILFAPRLETKEIAVKVFPPSASRSVIERTRIQRLPLGSQTQPAFLERHEAQQPVFV